MNKEFDKCYGQFGWREFLSNRKKILNDYYNMKDQTVNRPLKVAHGNSVEAYIRKWLSEFLPKKFAVTSGYVIPNLYEDSNKLYHYDIIIYNQLDSPILWIEGNEDQSSNGKYRAIPAKFVYAIYEVKSTFNKKSINDSINKLKEVDSFSNQLNKNYKSGIIFVELLETENHKVDLLKLFYEGKDVFGFDECLVLKYEGDELASGIVSVSKFDGNNSDDGEKKALDKLAKPIESLNIFSTERGEIKLAEQNTGLKLTCTAENEFSATKLYCALKEIDDYIVDLSWSRSTFSDFCVNLLANLEGYSIDDKRRSNFGRVFDNCKTKLAKVQGNTEVEGLPFILLKLDSLGNKSKLEVNESENSSLIVKFDIFVENHSNISVILSDDKFKSQIVLEGKKVASKKIECELQSQKGLEDLKNKMKKNGYEIPIRMVYHEDGKTEEFYSVENIITVSDDKFHIK